MTIYGTPKQCKKFPGFYKEFLKQEDIKDKIISKSYLTDFCKVNSINIGEGISDYQKQKIFHYFGVSRKNLEGINNINQLEKVINEHGKIPTEVDEQIRQEVLNLYSF
jgi:hypothetical protein